MKDKFPVLNTLITIQNVFAIIVALIGFLLLGLGLGESAEGLALIQIGVGLVFLVLGLVLRLGVEVVRVFLEIEKNTRKE